METADLTGAGETPQGRNPQAEGRFLFEARISGHGDISVGEDALHVQASFGEITIPYASLNRVATDTAGGIKLDAQGARLWLDITHFADRSELASFLGDKAKRRRSSS